LGFIITRQLIKEKAKEIINNEKFAASNSWLQGFLHRNLLTLRCLNEKSEQQEKQFEEISQKLVSCVKDAISKYKIQNSMIINMDESPYFWEYLPRKVICSSTLSKVAEGWKKNYYHERQPLF